MGGKKDVARRPYAPPSYAPPGPVESYRPRTPRETVNDARAAAHQTRALHHVTNMAFESVHDLTDHRDRIAAARPDLEASLNALLFNHVQGLLDVQSQVTKYMHREKS